MDFKSSHFSKVSNTIFLASIIFCLFFLWCNYCTKNINISFISSIIVFVAFLIIYIPIKIHHENKKKSLKSNKSKFEYFKLQLQYTQIEYILLFLKDYLKIDKCEHVSYNHYYINDSFDLYICLFNDNDFLLSNIFSCRKSSLIKILSPEIFDIPISIENVNIEFINLNELYKYSEQNNIEYLTKININKKPKYSPKDLLCIVLCKEKSKNYFWLGVLLLFSSLFTPYSTYYIVFSSILFIMSLISRFNFPFQSKKIKK